MVNYLSYLRFIGFVRATLLPLFRTVLLEAKVAPSREDGQKRSNRSDRHGSMRREKEVEDDDARTVWAVVGNSWGLRTTITSESRVGLFWCSL